MTDVRSIGVITVWYGGEHHVDRFVRNRKLIKEPEFVHVHVINRLQGEARRKLESRLPHSAFIDCGVNVGPARAWNMAMRFLKELGVGVVAVWNPDIELAPDCLQILSNALQADPSIGAASPLLFFSARRDVIQFFGGSVEIGTGRVAHDYRGSREVGSLPAFRDAGYLDGGSMMMEMRTAVQSGMFDENLFMYWEDVDLCMNIRKTGKRTVAIRDAHAWHYHDMDHGSNGTPYYTFYFYRNLLYMVRKHASRMEVLRSRFRLLWLLPRQTVSFLVHGEFDKLIPFWAGITCGLLGIMGKRGWVE